MNQIHLTLRTIRVPEIEESGIGISSVQPWHFHMKCQAVYLGYSGKHITCLIGRLLSYLRSGRIIVDD